MDLIAKYQSLIIWGLGGLLALAGLLLRNRIRQEVRDEMASISTRLNTHAQRLTEGDARFNAMDTKINGLPDAQAVTALAMAIEGLRGDLRVLGTRMEGFEGLQERIELQLRVMDDYLRRVPTRTAS